jgi:hypothetical protein
MLHACDLPCVLLLSETGETGAAVAKYVEATGLIKTGAAVAKSRQ